ncbi:aspartate/glutamate racemase family protein [Amphibacillus sp. Q70]|uniref:aspartate/glutamate racemase family protein n=1 Tax=Amphibacillus sp. Q70 TaxID=3453416 RepID=UPI003F87E1B5
MSKIFIIHTSFVSLEDLNKRFREYSPELQIFNIVDDSLLDEVSTVGDVTPSIVARMTSYFRVAEEKGADLIFNQCSSVGKAAEIAAKSVSIPVLRVDDAMACKAVEIGKRIAVVATVSSTIQPSIQIIKDKATKVSKEIVIEPVLIDGALKLLMEGKKDQHNKKVLEVLNDLDGDFDVIVLAQGSMVNLASLLSNMNTPVLTSPELGVRKAIASVRDRLASM